MSVYNKVIHIQKLNLDTEVWKIIIILTPLSIKLVEKNILMLELILPVIHLTSMLGIHLH